MLADNCFVDGVSMAGQLSPSDILERLRVTGKVADSSYDHLTKIAADVLDCEVSALKLAGKRSLWFASKVGTNLEQVDWNHSFCAHTIQSSDPLIVTDARVDERFSHLDLVRGDARLCSYVGAPVTLRGTRIGALCVASPESRSFSPKKIEILRELSMHASELLEAKAQQLELIEAREDFQLATNEAQRNIEFALHAARRFDQLFQAVPVACYSFDREGYIQEWNMAATLLYGFKPEEVVLKSLFQTIVPPERATEARRAMRAVLQGRTFNHIEWTDRSRDGRQLQVVGNSFPLYSPSGEIVGGVNAITDISDRALAERLIRDSQAFTTAILSAHPSVTYIYDLVERKNVFMNEEGLASLGYTKEVLDRIGGDILEDLIHPQDTQRVEAHHRAFTLDPALASAELEYRIRTFSGTYRWMRSRDVAFKRDDHGRTVQILGSALDIDERVKEQARVKQYSENLEIQGRHLRELNETLAQLAMTDGLTGLLNSQTARTEMQLRFKDASEYSLLAVLDVDQFKACNDEFGHPHGDSILKSLARIMKTILPPDAILGRFGGEEFGFWVQHDAADPNYAERLRKAVEAFEWTKRKVTISVGYVHPHDFASFSDALFRADEVLYEAKRAGKNRALHGAPLRGRRRAS